MCAICEFKVEFNVSHPHALTVAVNTRAAIDAAQLLEHTFDGALGQAKARASAINVLNELQTRIEQRLTKEEFAALPDFYVLLIESGTWGCFHATTNGFDPEIVPDVPEVNSDDPAQRDIAAIASEAAICALLDGSMAFERASSAGLIVVDALPAENAGVLAAIAGASGIGSPIVPREYGPIEGLGAGILI
ncbi:hypothetical protein AAGS40_26925 (plasmid) [Paraburkholderia sp. PREW-6R]|uniref:hypothetical protein n=1 Tax=Paraburkholderia sp. PREW-6R TaxID=3141544 RepID=UPI0031F4BAA5